MTRNVAASVHQRLLNRARAEGRPFNEVLQHFVMERFLYRLGRSAYRRRFVLKGALMFAVWQAHPSRHTRDIDLLGRMDNAVESVVSAIQAICREPAPEDGLRFAADTVVGNRIMEAANYEGVRVRFVAYLGKARIPLQLDIGFGDPVIPGPAPIRLPTLLDFPPPELQGYSRESAIAEKLQAMVYFGTINTRMKDFYDVWLLATRFDFDGRVLAQAIHETFRARQTALTPSPTAFSASFASDGEKQVQWTAFVRQHRIADAPATLGETVRFIAAFLQPVLHALAAGEPFSGHWPPGGPWTPPRGGVS